MQGNRIYPNKPGFLPLFKPGDYMYEEEHNRWILKTPNGLMGSIVTHTVIEHEDKTITVSPSILITYPIGEVNLTYHGYLEKGIWREV